MRAIIKIFRLVFLFLLISCHAQNQEKSKRGEITGNYTNNFSKKNPNSERITLKKNYKVNYFLQIEALGNLEIDGTWKFSNDTLLFSFELPKYETPGKIEVLRGKMKRDSINVNVKDKFGLLFGGKLFLNGQEYNIDSESFKIQSQYIRSIDLFFDNQTYHVNINEVIDTDISIFVTLTEFRGIIFDFIKTKWIYRDNKLIEINRNGINDKHFLIKS